MLEELLTSPYAKDPKNLEWEFHEERDSRGERVVSSIFTAEWAEKSQSFERSKPGCASKCLNLYGLFIDGTNLDLLGRNMALPVILTCLNFTHDVIRRQGSKRVIAWVPTVKCTKSQGASQSVSDARLELFHDVLGIILQPIKVSVVMHLSVFFFLDR